MTRFEQVTQPSNTEFSDWIQPTMNGYKMACCDCGLVHDIDFRVVRVVEELPRGYVKVKDVKANSLIVQFKARRNNRSTGQKRRGQK